MIDTKTLFEALVHGEDIYQRIGSKDSATRSECFSAVAKDYEISFDDMHEMWESGAKSRLMDALNEFMDWQYEDCCIEKVNDGFESWLFEQIAAAAKQHVLEKGGVDVG